MAAFKVDPKSIRAFATDAAFESWLERNHDRASEIFIRIYKKNSGKKSVTHESALDIALCWGWIDGIRKPYDEDSFLQRYTPRGPKSRWSDRNRKHVARLVAAGRMTPHGLKHVEAAKADGRWTSAYAPASEMRVPADLLAAIEAEPKALRTFKTLNKANLYALAYRTETLKTPAGRAKRIADFVEKLKRGETPHPNAPSKKA